MKRFNLLFATTLAIAFLTQCNNAPKQSKDYKSAFDTAGMDKSHHPGDDFYRFASGTWIKNNPLPPDKSRFGAFDKLAELSTERVKAIIDEASKDTSAKPGSNSQKIRDFYNVGMDTVKIEADGINPIKEWWDKIAAAKTTEDVQALLLDFQMSGFSSGFYFYSGIDDKNSEAVIANLWQGGLSMPDRDYYLEDNPRFNDIRKQYEQHVANMFKLAGSNEADAKKAAATVLKTETLIAKGHNSRLVNRDPDSTYHLVKLDELEKMAPNVNWKTYFTTIGLPEPGNICVAQPRHMQNFSKLIKSVSLADWQQYLRWHLLNSASGALSSAFDNEHFNFYGKILSGKQQQEPRWKRISDNTSDVLGEVIGQLFVAKHFSPEAKQRMSELVGNLKKAMESRINKLDWMSNETKKEALAKLAKINVKIGYPDEWRDYSGLEIKSDSYLANLVRSSKFEFAYGVNKVGKPVNRKEWGMTPQTVNAYYSPSRNEIVFPAAILQPPFFNMEADDAINYGAIGVVIGHEITHGFDDQGRKYDKDGNLRDWWTEADGKEFEKRAQMLVDHYNSFTIKFDTTTMHVDGKLTLGENIADVGGLNIALEAYRMSLAGKTKPEEIDGYTDEQRFFLGYAQVWKQNISDKELQRRLTEDVHSPGEYRVNGGVFNIPDFYTAFGIDSTAKLYRSPAQIPHIW